MSKTKETTTTILVGEFKDATVIVANGFFRNKSIDPLDFVVDMEQLGQLQIDINGVTEEAYQEKYLSIIKNKRDASEEDVKLADDIKELGIIKQLGDVKSVDDLNERLGELGIDTSTLRKEYHEVSCGKQTYRFLTPECLSDKSINMLRTRHNVITFGGDLKDMLINISKDGSLSARHVPELSN